MKRRGGTAAGRIRTFQDGRTEAQLPDVEGEEVSGTFPTPAAARAWLRAQKPKPAPAAETEETTTETEEAADETPAVEQFYSVSGGGLRYRVKNPPEHLQGQSWNTEEEAQAALDGQEAAPTEQPAGGRRFELGLPARDDGQVTVDVFANTPDDPTARVRLLNEDDAFKPLRVRYTEADEKFHVDGSQEGFRRMFGLAPDETRSFDSADDVHKWMRSAWREPAAEETEPAAGFTVAADAEGFIVKDPDGAAVRGTWAETREAADAEAKRLNEGGKPPEVEEETATEPADVPARIRQAIMDVLPADAQTVLDGETGREASANVELADVRDKLADLPRADVDKVLHEMHRAGDIAFTLHEDRRKIDDRVRAAQLTVGNAQMDMVNLRDVAPGTEQGTDFDPVQVAKEGEDALRERLRTLTLDEMHGLIAEGGMDPGKQTRRWRERERLADWIVDVAGRRATHGDAFRDHTIEDLAKAAGGRENGEINLSAFYGETTAERRAAIADELAAADRAGKLPAGLKLVEASTATRGPQSNVFRTSDGEVAYVAARAAPATEKLFSMREAERFLPERFPGLEVARVRAPGGSYLELKRDGKPLGIVERDGPNDTNSGEVEWEVQADIPVEERTADWHDWSTRRGQDLDPLVDALVRGELRKPQEAAADEPAGDQEYEYSSTQLPIDDFEELIDFQHEIASDDFAPEGLEGEPHVTVLYGLETAEPDDVQRHLKDQPPIELTLGKVSTFPDRGDGEVLKVEVKSPDLRALHARLRDALPHKKSDFPEYSPHVTIGYLKPGRAKKYTGARAGITGKQFYIDKLTFSSKTGDMIDIALKGDRPLPAWKAEQEKKLLPIKPHRFADYEPENLPLPKPGPAARAPFRFEHDGREWWTQGHVLFEGKAPRSVGKVEDGDPATAAKMLDAWRSEYQNEVYPVAVSREAGGWSVHFNEEGLTVDARYFDYARKKFPNVTFKHAPSQIHARPLTVYSNGDFVGLVMGQRVGMEIESEVAPFRADRTGPIITPKGKPKPVEQLRTKERVGTILELSNGQWMATTPAGAQEQFPDARAARAWLRAAPGTSQAAEPKPKKKPAGPVRFGDMTDAERSAEIARLRAARKAKMAGAAPAKPAATPPKPKRDATSGTLADADGAAAAATPRPAKRPRKPKPKTATEAGQRLKSAGGHATAGMKDALKGLKTILQPDPKQLNMGFAFSDEQYQQAKPLFQNAWREAQEAAWDFSAFVEWLVDQLIEEFNVDVDAAYDTADRFQKEQIAQEAGDEREPADGADGATKPGGATADAGGGRPDKPVGEDGAGVAPTGGKARPGKPGDAGETAAGERGERGAREPSSGRSSGAGAISRGPHPDGPVGVGPDTTTAPPAPYLLTPKRMQGIIGGATEMAENNVEAMETLRTLQRENRWATADEQETLAKWRGWGGEVKQYLEPQPRRNWSARGREIHARIQAMTTPIERGRLRGSTTNAHYTFSIYPPLWEALRRYGVPPGLHILSPSLGSGHEFMTMPPEIRQGAQLTAFEIEPATAQIAKMLSPDATVYATGFEESVLPAHSQDLMVTNVPFGAELVSDKHLPRLVRGSIHNYFFAKATTLLKPGGLLAFFVTHYTMDGTAHRGVREWLTNRMDFLGAVRLPNTAFQQGARTEVVTDLVVMRRREEGAAPAPDNDLFLETEEIELERWTKGKKIRQKFNRSTWYREHPELVMGEEAPTGTMRSGEEYNVEGKLQPKKFMQALESILPPGAWQAPGRGVPVEAFADAQNEQPVGSYILEGTTLRRVDEDGQVRDYLPMTKPTETRPSRVDTKRMERIKAHVGVRAALDDVMASQSAPDDELASAQRILKTEYDQFKRQWGDLNSRANRSAYGGDPYAPRLRRLEVVEQIPGKKGKPKQIKVVGLAPVFTTRVLREKPLPAHIPVARDALVGSIAMFGEINWRYMSEVSGKGIYELQERLRDDRAVFLQPSGGYMTREAYLHRGDVLSRLEQARELAETDERFAANVEELERVQPAPLTVEQIDLKIGQPWISPQLYAEFIDQQLGLKANVMPGYTDTGQKSFWTIKKVRDATILTASNAHQLAVKAEESTWGFLDILRAKLNMRAPRLTYTEGTGDAKETYFDAQGTMAVANALSELDYYWENWVAQDANRLKGLLDTFNTKFNRFAKPEFDTKPIMPMLRRAGFSLQSDQGKDLDLYEHQQRGVYRAVTGGNTLIAHDTGAGKTMELLSIAMLWKRIGRAHKPMLVVHDKTVPGFQKEAARIFPGANGLFLEQEVLENKTHREEAFAQAAYGDWDFIVVTHTGFQHISPSVEQQRQIHAEFEADILSVMDQADKEEIKDLKNQLARIKDKLAKLEEMQDSGVTWEEMGVDAVIVDEAHSFKNLYFSTKLAGRSARVKGISPSDSDKAFNLFAKIRAVNRSSGERNVVMATATPVMNSPAEFYTMLRYLQPGLLRQLGLTDFDAYASQFLGATEIDDPRPDGTTVRLRAINRYQNLKTLHSLFSQVTDYVPTEAMPYLKLPKLKGGAVRTIETPKHPIWNDVVQPWIDKRMERFRNNPTYKDRQGVMHGEKKIHPFTGDEGEKYENVPNIIDDSAAAALDLRLVKGFEGVDDFAESRVNQAADIAAEYHKRTTEATATTPARGAAFIFADIGVPKKEDLEPLPFLADIEADDEVSEAEQEAADAVAASDASNFNLYDAIRDALVARGIPRHEIAYVQQARGDAQRAILYQKVRDGEIRFLIGSTDVGGTGVNVQERLGLMIHMDSPKLQRPGDLHQREGRIIRQGNLFDVVEIVRFVTPGTADELKFSTLITKAKFIKALMSGDIERWEDVMLDATQDLETARRLATGDMRVLKLRDLKQTRSRLTAAIYNDQTKNRSQRIEIEHKKGFRREEQKKLDALQKFHDTQFKRQIGDDVELEIDGSYYGFKGGRASGTGPANELFMTLIEKAQAGYGREKYRLRLGGMPFTLSTHKEHGRGASWTIGNFDDELSGSLLVRRFDTKEGIPERVATTLAGYYNGLPQRIEERQERIAAIDQQIETLEQAIGTTSTDAQRLKKVEKEIEDLEAVLGTAEHEARERMRKEAAERAARTDKQPSGQASKAGYDVADMQSVEATKSKADFAGYDVEHLPDPALRTGVLERPARPEAEPVIDGGLVMPAAMPELNELIETIGGHLRPRKPRGHKHGVVGRFLAPGRILIHPDLFLIPKWRQQARAVVAHEIGHFISWRPEQTFSKGNVLGHIAGLPKFLKHTFTIDGEEFKLADVRGELLAWTQRWKPLSAAPTQAELDYRSRAGELFADAISGLLMNPRALAQTAPKFYRMLFKTLPEHSPDVYDAYLELRERLAGPRAARIRHIRGAVARGTQQGVQRRIDALREQSQWMRLMREARWNPVEVLKSQILEPFFNWGIDLGWSVAPRGEEGQDGRRRQPLLRHLGTAVAVVATVPPRVLLPGDAHPGCRRAAPGPRAAPAARLQADRRGRPQRVPQRGRRDRRRGGRALRRRAGAGDARAEGRAARVDGFGLQRLLGGPQTGVRRGDVLRGAHGNDGVERLLRAVPGGRLRPTTACRGRCTRRRGRPAP